MSAKPRKFSKSKTAQAKGWLPNDENTIDRIIIAVRHNPGERENAVRALANTLLYEDADLARSQCRRIRKVRLTLTITVEEID